MLDYDGGEMALSSAEGLDDFAEMFQGNWTAPMNSHTAETPAKPFSNKARSQHSPHFSDHGPTMDQTPWVELRRSAAVSLDLKSSIFRKSRSTRGARKLDRDGGVNRQRLRELEAIRRPS